MEIDPEIDRLVRLGQRLFLLEGMKNGLSFLVLVGISLGGGTRMSKLFQRKQRNPSYYESMTVEIVGWDDSAEPDEETEEWFYRTADDFMFCCPPVSIANLCTFLELDSAEWRYTDSQVLDCLERYPNVSKTVDKWIREMTKGDYQVVGVSHKNLQDQRKTVFAIADMSHPISDWGWTPEGIKLKPKDRMKMSLVFYNFLAKESFRRIESESNLSSLKQAVKKRAGESRVEWFERMHEHFDISAAGTFEETDPRFQRPDQQ